MSGQTTQMKKLKDPKIKGWIYLPGDMIEAELTFHGVEWALTVFDLDVELRNQIKYGNKFKTPKEALNWARETLHELLDTRNLSLDMIL